MDKKRYRMIDGHYRPVVNGVVIKDIIATGDRIDVMLSTDNYWNEMAHQAKETGNRVIDTYNKRTGYLLYGTIYWHNGHVDNSASYANLTIQSKLANKPAMV